MKKNTITIAISLLLFVAAISNAVAQCAMCKSSIESNGTLEVTDRAEGLNTGILYLMTIPYIIFGVIGYLWYKNSKKTKVSQDKINELVSKAINN